MSRKAIIALTIAAVVATTLGIAAIFRGSPAAQSVAGPDAPRPIASSGQSAASVPSDIQGQQMGVAAPPPTVKYLKRMSCPPLCAAAVAYTVEEDTASRSQYCPPHCLTLKAIDPATAQPQFCPPACLYTLVDEPDDTCEYRVTIADAQLADADNLCPPTCAYSVEPYASKGK